MAVMRAFLVLALISACAVSAQQLQGAQPDGGLYITPEIMNNCKALPGTAVDGSGNAMILTATGTVTDVKEEGTDLGDCCPPPYKGAAAVSRKCPEVVLLAAENWICFSGGVLHQVGCWKDLQSWWHGV
jgi:hypothetical protein